MARFRRRQQCRRTMASRLKIPDAICVFEARAIGDPAWRHFENLLPQNDGEGPLPTGREAGKANSWVRSASAVGNYDYLIDYVFHQDGSIRVRVGAHGR